MDNFVSIIGFYGYEIALAPVRVRRASGQPKKFHLDAHGYYVVNLGKDNNDKKCKRMVHRIVATMFVLNPENKPQVNHKDGNKLNNEPDNLEWVTAKENMRHAYKLGLMPRKLSKEDILFIQQKFSLSEVNEVAKKFKISKGYAQCLISGRLIMNENGLLDSHKIGYGKRVINSETGQIYRSGAELAMILGVRRKYITRKLNGERRNNTPYRYLAD